MHLVTHLLLTYSFSHCPLTHSPIVLFLHSFTHELVKVLGTSQWHTGGCQADEHLTLNPQHGFVVLQCCPGTQPYALACLCFLPPAQCSPSAQNEWRENERHTSFSSQVSSLQKTLDQSANELTHRFPNTNFHPAPASHLNEVLACQGPVQNADWGTLNGSSGRMHNQVYGQELELRVLLGFIFARNP